MIIPQEYKWDTVNISPEMLNHYLNFIIKLCIFGWKKKHRKTDIEFAGLMNKMI